MGRGQSKAMHRYKAYKARKAHKKTRVVFGAVEITKATEVKLVPEMDRNSDFERAR